MQRVHVEDARAPRRCSCRRSRQAGVGEAEEPDEEVDDAEAAPDQPVRGVGEATGRPAQSCRSCGCFLSGRHDGGPTDRVWCRGGPRMGPGAPARPPLPPRQAVEPRRAPGGPTPYVAHADQAQEGAGRGDPASATFPPSASRSCRTGDHQGNRPQGGADGHDRDIVGSQRLGVGSARRGHGHRLCLAPCVPARPTLPGATNTEAGRSHARHVRNEHHHRRTPPAAPRLAWTGSSRSPSGARPSRGRSAVGW